EALQGGLPVAGELNAAAVQAGTDPAPLAARRAQAAAAVGDLDTALAMADQALAQPLSDTDRGRAVAVAAAVLAQRGMLARSAELYRWLATIAPGQSDPEAAVPALIGIGELAEARELLEPASPGSAGGPPRLLAGAETLMAHGMFATITGSPVAALSQLTRAAALLEPSGSTSVLPDTPAALAALVALHSGELDVAQSVLDRAVAGQLGGRAAVARHLLLQAWIAMQRGATGQARALLADVAALTGKRLEPRDELVAAALEVALARRASDLPALMAAWSRAREAIVRHPVDLYVLQPLGELLVGAARLREQGWVQPHFEEALALLAKLGDPPLWAVPLHWSAMHAAIAGEQHAAAEHHAAALEKAGTASRYAAAMATAARLWLGILGGLIDATAVEGAARALHAVGLTWEGGRLAGQAAIRTTERKDMTALLSCARALQVGVIASVPSQGAAGGAPAGAAARPAPHANGPDSRLSDREREVAQLVLSGLTYKQIGEQLFISAKTVEHHMARIRQRLGSGSRGELFAHLRSLVGPTDS
ncbi:MAG: regulatory protein LuxR, partial [Pseudonocardia sp.]|nr:regulatory protein LuxR [Pseudonocardia sp.]